MHYGKTAFSKNGKVTIQAIGNPNQKFGQRDGLSPLDIAGINKLYDCSTSSRNGISRWSPWSSCVGAENCQKQRQRFCFHNSCPNVDQYGVETERARCSTNQCRASINGHWGRWSGFGACDCSAGTKSRTRKCDDPKPSNGGAQCSGLSKQKVSCRNECGGGNRGSGNRGGSSAGGVYDTNFERGVGKWRDVGRIRWILQRGGTPTSNTGPSSDHTLGTSYGRYIYMEASGRRYGDQAILELTNYSSRSQKCMKVYFYMYGSEMGSLKIAFENNGGYRRRRQVVMSVAGNRGRGWHSVQIGVPPLQNYKIELIATRGFGSKSDIALDDIKFMEGRCPNKK
ncbi:uncharacterized protein LOC141907676 isoform X2 [Tubulanus polymorphus]|uniref:uncharacterized protein LOC141907676 isoform X2 n=1 Tax=Tubulanus polymorphus TaxID=672921 RepID=UPI003DA4EB9D